MVTRILGHYDATPHIGLNVIVCNSAIERTDETGEQTIELPKQRELRATAAVLRCLMPEQLQAAEIEALRKILALPADSEAKRPVIPTEGGHPIRSKAATDSDRRRPPC